MQNKDYILDEIEKNREVIYTSAELNDIIFSDVKESLSFSKIITNKGTFNAIILNYSKTQTKTSIKLLIKKNILTKLILSTFNKIEIQYSDSERKEYDFKELELIKQSIYLNSNQDTIVKLKFYNKGEYKWILILINL